MTVKVFSGDNPSQLYMDALVSLLLEGDEVSPRGKKIKELRPTVFEYTNPKNRVTFLNGRVINPFFQLAESFWILAGRSDVKWLMDYNKSIAQFSDDGEFFNAPYGERLRYWNKNDATGFIFSPMDQLYDVYQKIKADPDTRQAVAIIYNPIFDHAERDTKDRPCNIALTFKLRNGKLDLTVYNRSNDLHWGTFGANLCQFATIQEVVASWLGVEIGTYYQITDSLHIYLEDYGAQETDKVLNAYKMDKDNLEVNMVPKVKQFVFENEPRFNSSFEDFESIVNYYFSQIDPLFKITMPVMSTWEQSMVEGVLDRLEKCPDPYLRLTFQAIFVKLSHNRKDTKSVFEGMKRMADSSWKVSCLRFLSKSYGDNEEFKSIYSHLDDDIKNYIERKEG
jgi:thymidylate synthase